MGGGAPERFPETGVLFSGSLEEGLCGEVSILGSPYFQKLQHSS